VVKRLGRLVGSTFAETRSHVPTTVVQQAVSQARAEGVDGIVSFGGGSCADLGKAVAFFLEQEAGTPGASYLHRPALPHVSVPTTYSGAELTPFFGMTDEATRQKSGSGGPTIAPVAAIYDPELTLDTPGQVSAETGMNALAHGIECAWSPAATPEAEAIALACIQRVAASLPLVVERPLDIGPRTLMLEGASLGGRCLQNASMGVHHGLSQLVGGRTGIPHGLANAILLSHAVRFNEGAVNLGPIGLALGDADDAAGAVDRLRASVGLPARLSEVGVTEDDLDAVARLSQRNHNVANNPKPVSEDDARAILDAAF
jgi:alcohol dehydrogenase class IV